MYDKSIVLQSNDCITEVNKDVMTKVLHYKRKQRCMTKVLYYKSKQWCYDLGIVLQK